MINSSIVRPRNTYGRYRTLPQRRVEAVIRVVTQVFNVAFPVVSLFILSGAVVSLLFPATVDGEFPAVRRLILRVIVVVSALAVMSNWKSVIGAIRRYPWAVTLVGLALLSAGWSVAPGQTLRRSVALLGGTALGLYLGARFSTERLLRITLVALGTATLLSLAFAVAVPSVGISHGLHEGAWRGVFGNKNNAGAVAGLTLVFGLVFWLDSRRSRLLLAVMMLPPLALLVLSRSMSAVVASAAIAVLLPFLYALRARPTTALLVANAAIIIAAATGLYLTSSYAEPADAYADVLRALGRETTLTGRSEIWSAALEMMRHKAWLGYGFGAFWNGANSPASEVWAMLDGWPAPHAHNGYLDLGLDLGVVGLGVLSWALAMAVLRGIAVLRSSATPAGVWPLAFIGFILLYNISESAMMNIKYSILYWVLYLAAMTAAPGARASGELAPRARGVRSGGVSFGIRRRLRHKSSPHTPASRQQTPAP